MRTDIRFTTRQLFLWLSVYAVLFGAIAGLPVPTIQVVGAVIVVTVFVIVDAWSALDRSNVPASARCAIVVAHYASAFAAAVGVCFVLYLLVPKPPAPPQPPLSGLAAVFHIVSGQVIRDAVDAIGEEISIRITYVSLFSVVSTIAFCSSLFALRQLRSAKWYALVNSAGTCLFIVSLVAILIDSIEG